MRKPSRGKNNSGGGRSGARSGSGKGRSGSRSTTGRGGSNQPVRSAFSKRNNGDVEPNDAKPTGRTNAPGKDARPERSDSRDERTQRTGYQGKKPFRTKKPSQVRYNDSDEIRLNKYISNAGVCSRRDADILIESGVVSVNGKVVTALGTKVKKTDVVKYDNNTLSLEGLRYFVMNKPKDYITTMDDPKNRRTVMLLIKGACKERVYPVGRLDRDTTGLLLFTNDGDLSKALTHPSTNTKKIYHVHLDKQMTEEDLAKLLEGVQLEDGLAKADEASFVGESSRQVGIELHSGKNRIVRRMIASLGYGVKKLDRVYFAGLTKKDLPRGKYRMLTEEEVIILKRSVKLKS